MVAQRVTPDVAGARLIVPTARLTFRHGRPMIATPNVPASVAFGIRLHPSSAVRAGRRALGRLGAFGAIAALAAAIAVAAPARSAAAQTDAGGGGLTSDALDSVRAGLASRDVDVRHAALARLNAAYERELPPAIVEPVLALLEREAADDTDHAGDEDFGEYIVDLVLTGVRTNDPRAVPSVLRLDGLGMSSGVASFVAKQGRAVMPALDAHALTREDRATDVLEAYALMYARHGALLSRGDSVQVLRRLIAAASDTGINVRSQLAYFSSTGPIPELLPAVEVLARSDPETLEGVYVVRRSATAALPVLQRARAAMSTRELLNRLTLLTDAACDLADARAVASCVALRAGVADGARFVALGQPRLSTKALDGYQAAAQRLGATGAVPRLTVVVLDGGVRAVIARLTAP